MYFQVPRGERPEAETPVSFELIVPPGEGYALTPGKVKGAGAIVRTDTPSPDTIGVAVRFTRPLALEF